jgi:hypothetical protein
LYCVPKNNNINNSNDNNNNNNNNGVLNIPVVKKRPRSKNFGETVSQLVSHTLIQPAS